MNNILEVLHLNRGSEIEHRIRRNATIRQCVLYYRLRYDAHTVRPDFLYIERNWE